MGLDVNEEGLLSESFDDFPSATHSPQQHLNLNLNPVRIVVISVNTRLIIII